VSVGPTRSHLDLLGRKPELCDEKVGMPGQHTAGHAAQPLSDVQRARRQARIARREKVQAAQADRSARASRRLDKIYGDRPPRRSWSRRTAVPAIFALAGLAMLIAGAVLLPAAVAAAMGRGIHGSFNPQHLATEQVTIRSETQTETVWTGTFTASGGTPVVHDAPYYDPPVSLRKGHPEPGLLLGGSEVVAPAGSTEWLLPAGMIVLGSYLAGIWLWLMPIGRWRERRRVRNQLLGVQSSGERSAS
jgi:hypothetical protein